MKLLSGFFHPSSPNKRSGYRHHSQKEKKIGDYSYNYDDEYYDYDPNYEDYDEYDYYYSSRIRRSHAP